MFSRERKNREVIGICIRVREGLIGCSVRNELEVVKIGGREICGGYCNSFDSCCFWYWFID